MENRLIAQRDSAVARDHLAGGSCLGVGAAEGCVPIQLGLRYPHLTGGGFDLPAVGPAFDDLVASHDLAGRMRFYAGDFFADPLPPADVLIMGHILHDWSLEEMLTLLRKAYQALPDGGALIVYDAIIDDDRASNTLGLLMSVNMLIETQAGFDYTAAYCRSWMTDVGFRNSYTEPLAGPDSMVVGSSNQLGGLTRHGSREYVFGLQRALCGRIAACGCSTS